MISLNKNMAPEFDNTKSYSYGDNVIYNKTLYQYISASNSVAGTFNPDDWKVLYLYDVVEGKGGSDDCKYIAPEYDSSLTYNTDDTVLYNGYLYKCLLDNVTGAWNEDKWEKINLVDVGELNSNLANDVVLATYRSNTVGYAYYGEQNNVCNLTYTFTSNYKRVIVVTRNILSGDYNSTNEVTNFTSNNSSKVQPYCYEIKNVVENQTFTATYTGLKTQTNYDNKVEAVIIGFN